MQTLTIKTQAYCSLSSVMAFFELNNLVDPTDFLDEFTWGACYISLIEASAFVKAFIRAKPNETARIASMQAWLQTSNGLMIDLES